jgi:hypothetical protein
MGAFAPVLIFLLVGGVIAAAIVATVVYERKRTQAVKELAESIGLSFFPHGDPALVGSLSSFPLFSQGSSRTICNMIHGDTHDVVASLFDYKFTVGSGKNKSTHHQTVVCIQSSEMHLPVFTLRPEHFFHRIGAVFGIQDIDFPTHPEFSKLFLVQGASEEQIRGLFTPAILSYFEGKKGIAVEADGRRVLVYRARVREKPAAWLSRMEEAFEIYGLMKKRSAELSAGQA